MPNHTLYAWMRDGILFTEVKGGVGMSADRIVQESAPGKKMRPDPMTIDAYRELVQQVMRDTSASAPNHPRVFTNSGAEHARVVAETMLQNAHSCVDIFSHELGLTVWRPEWFEELLEREPTVKVRLLVDQEACLDSDHSALHALKGYVGKGRIEVRRYGKSGDWSHLTIVDKRHLRLEQDHDAKKAVVAFGGDDLGRDATETFDTFWRLATPE